MGRGLLLHVVQGFDSRGEPSSVQTTHSSRFSDKSSTTAKLSFPQQVLNNLFHLSRIKGLADVG